MKLTLISAMFVLLTSLPASSPTPEPGKSRVIAVQTYTVPRSEWDGFFSFVDEYIVPRLKANPHIISSRVATHYYGPSEPNIWRITEYASLGEIDLAEAWNDQYDKDHYPAGSAKRDSFDVRYKKYFMPYWENHSDNLLQANENRIK
ncbi:MAG: hypothetical protein HY033_00645 [Ignavibacteriae bacterium]|nr:hypothetical protein [Ignavibacteria bacterium]MBI3363397.1 hypothetical protein [Ignavibacteriota bacterium]